MPDHSPEHMARMTEESAANRRAAKVAKLLETSPPLNEKQGGLLHSLVDDRMAAYVDRVVAAAPPLDEGMKQKLAAILAPAVVRSP